MTVDAQSIARQKSSPHCPGSVTPSKVTVKGHSPVRQLAEGLSPGRLVFLLSPSHTFDFFMGAFERVSEKCN